MINFIRQGNDLILQYVPDVDENWVIKALEEKKFIVLKKTFSFDSADLTLINTTTHEKHPFEEIEPTASYFRFASLQGDYYKVVDGILIKSFHVYIYKDILPSVNYFVADSNVSVFKVIENISKNDFYIGGESPSAIPVDVFEDLLKQFPKAYERKKYVEARIAAILRNHLDNVKDAERKYQRYLNTKLSFNGANLVKTFKDVELIKYQTILEKLGEMLNDEIQYSEHQWQEEILQIILLLYPKYIFAFKSVPILAKLSDGIREKQLDFLLVDSNGYVDIIEIKKPFENAIMTKGVYRENYIPLRELSGTVMQIEKYIYYLNRWSLDGERFLSEKYQTQLPNGFDIKIANPGGIIIMGRENNLSIEQKRDFEVVKRKYKNVVDIITYDNLIERLKYTIEQIKKV
jgi:hypothetical protein